MPDDGKTTDVLGLAPYGESLNTLTRGAVDGASAFLSRICLPAAEELGYLFQDKVREWRQRNGINTVLMAQEIFDEKPDMVGMHALPRLVHRIFEDCSWCDDQSLQALWAGLLVSSCSEDGRDDSNMIFINLLGQCTTSEVKLVSFICSSCEKNLGNGGWVFAKGASYSAEILGEIMDISDLHRIDRELDHLRSIGILDANSGFDNLNGRIASICPSPLALQMFARCQGHRGSPESYYGLVCEGTEQEANGGADKVY